MLALRQLYVILVMFAAVSRCDDYYEMFGIARDATNRDIRKAFKKLAVTLHPDKNPDDPEADAKFIKVTRAYEVLKDTESRKRYDLYGDDATGATGGRHEQNFHSWSYYHDQFGIYDDDPEIVTLSHADFDNSVRSSSSVWYVNFYSTQCSHCHHLAPAWRAVARSLRGVARVAAVNCDEDWQLCRQQNVRSYPSVVIYPTREKYQGDRNEDDMVGFVVERLPVSVAQLTSSTWDRGRPWVVFLCDGLCHDDDTRVFVAAILSGLVDVGTLDCDSDPALCDRLLPGTTASSGGVVYWSGPDQSQRLDAGPAFELANQVLALLPEATQLDEDTFQDLLARLEQGATGAWLVHFDIGATTDEDLEWRRLPSLAPSLNVARVHCGRYVNLCQRLHVRKYPTFLVLKPGGGVETHHGRTSVHDVADFARDSAEAPNVRSLAPDEFQQLVSDGRTAWFVDFYAPWCPPCLRLLPELRTASRHFLPSAVSFGTVDCTVHEALCRQQQVTSYPTTMLFNSSTVVSYHGTHKADGVTEFIQDIISPTVTRLTGADFHTTVGAKEPTELWMVDFFAPWCGPCQQLAPEWRKLAKMVSHLSHVRMGSVDCVAEADLCSQQGVRSYPTVRLYPVGARGLATVALYSGHQRDAHSLRAWLFHFLPSPVVELDAETFRRVVSAGDDAWLVDFYAPWCGHCVVFEPEFKTLAARLEKRVKCGTLNCERHRAACVEAGVRGYPTVMLYGRPWGGGREIRSQSGDEILRLVDEALAEGVATVTRHDEF